MNIALVALILTFFIYGFAVDCKLLAIYFSIIGVYALINILLPNKYNSPRRKIMMATWSEPSEGNIFSRFEYDTRNYDRYIEKTKEKAGIKVTLTHVAIKALAEVLKTAPDINGKISFGKFIPYDKVSISCLVDIEGGKDLASITIEDCDKLTLEEVAEFIRDKARNIKEKKGDADHKKRTGPAHILPTFVVSWLMELSSFLTVYLGLSIPAVGLKKYPFGGGLVTSVGMFNIKDTFAPFPGFTKVPMAMTVCAVEKKPIAEGDRVVVAPVIGLNVVLDHRYMDGARAGKLQIVLDDVFLHPEKYSKFKDELTKAK